MKIINALILFVLFLVAGCATSGTVVKVNSFTPSSFPIDMDLASVNVNHYSDLSVVFGAIGAMITSGDTPIDKEIYDAIYKDLSTSKLLDMSSQDIGGISDNPSKLSVNVRMIPIMKGAMSGKFGALVNWKIVDSSEKVLVDIQTRAEDDEVFSEFYTSTKKPKHKGKVLNVVKRNTEDFLLLLSGKSPKYGHISASNP